jgi:hypothetical protein
MTGRLVVSWPPALRAVGPVGHPAPPRRAAPARSARARSSAPCAPAPINPSRISDRKSPSPTGTRRGPRRRPPHRTQYAATAPSALCLSVPTPHPRRTQCMHAVSTARDPSPRDRLLGAMTWGSRRRPDRSSRCTAESNTTTRESTVRRSHSGSSGRCRYVTGRRVLRVPGRPCRQYRQVATSTMSGGHGAATSSGRCAVGRVRQRVLG